MDKHFDYKEACDYIENAARLGSRPGLERIRGLCERLGDPQDRLRFIHIAGTNGKGSTSCMIASVLAEAGLCVGTYNSPAVSGIRDHYRINGNEITESEYANAVSLVATANEKLMNDTGDEATQFELETAVAFTIFAENHCDAVVLECGMGGRDDATNIVRNKICCVFTSISRDHMQYLGDTIKEIAELKAGIITSGCPVTALDSDPEATEVIRKRCEVTGSILYTVRPDEAACTGKSPFGQTLSCKEYSDIETGLPGTFQVENAALAIRTLTVLNEIDPVMAGRIGEPAVRAGLKKASWPYRFECISRSPLFIIDGAHNEDAAYKLKDTIRQYLDGYRIILIMGVFADKEYDKIAGLLAGEADDVIAVETPDNPRALPAADLAKTAGKYCDRVRACGSIKEAYDAAMAEAKRFEDAGENPAIVACGSLSYLNELRQKVECRHDNKGQGI